MSEPPEELSLIALFAIAAKNARRMARASVISSLAAVVAVGSAAGLVLEVQARTHENCVSSNEDRRAIVAAVRDLESSSNGDGPFQIPISVAEGDPRLERLMTNVNEVLARQGDTGGGDEPTATEIVEDRLPQRDC